MSQNRAVLGWGRILGFLGGVTTVSGTIDILEPAGGDLVWLLIVLVGLFLLVLLTPRILSVLLPRFWKPSHRRPSLIGLG